MFILSIGNTEGNRSFYCVFVARIINRISHKGTDEIDINGLFTVNEVACRKPYNVGSEIRSSWSSHDQRTILPYDDTY